LEDPAGFSGGPAVAGDGTIYIPGRGGSLYSLSPQGELKWEVTLPARPVGTPAIGSEGNIYLSDNDGALSAYAPNGDPIWRFIPQGKFKATSGPAIGPDGTFYYATVAGTGMIQAVSPAGEGQWLAELKTSFFYNTPQVSPDGDYIFFRNEVFDRVTGAPLDFDLDFEVDQFFAGEDGRNYLRSVGTVVAWKASGTGISLVEERVLADEHMGTPNRVLVSPEGVVGLQYNTGVMWFTRSGEALGVSFPKDSFLTHTAAIDHDFTLYTCGRRPVNMLQNSKPACFALTPQGDQPRWEAVLGNRLEGFAGSALVAGRLYVATEEGHLYAIGGGQ
jgi:outer membrane protein assembly factor BamB